MPSVQPLKRRRTPETSRKVHQAQEDTKRIARETRITSQLLDLNTEVESVLCQDCWILRFNGRRKKYEI